MQRRAIFAAGTAAVAGAVAGASLISITATARPSRTPIPDIEVADQDGRPTASIRT